MNIEAVNEQTLALVSQGHRVFQIHRFAEGEAAHVARLEGWAAFQLNARVIDMGSGTGEVAKIFSKIRHDLDFCLVNISAVQIAYSPDFKSHCCDFCAVPEPDASFDAAMFCFSIGHADLNAALKEAHRLLRSGATLFIYDMARVGGSNDSMTAVDYVVHSREAMQQALHDAGFKSDFYMEPHDDGSYGRQVIGDAYQQVFDGTIPAIWRMIKC